MKKILIVCCAACLVIGFFFGRWSTVVKETVRYVEGKTIRDTITRFVPDTVYLAGELKYKYVYVPDTIYKDVPVIDREKSIVETIKDWNKTRKYKKMLFDNESGKLSVDLFVQYNELQCLSYTFTPTCKETTMVKKRVFEPFISTSFGANNTLSMGGGFFYYDVGFRVEYSSKGACLGVMYRF